LRETKRRFWEAEIKAYQHTDVADSSLKGWENVGSSFYRAGIVSRLKVEDRSTYSLSFKVGPFSISTSKR
jgi:hypothetical protein